MNKHTIKHLRLEMSVGVFFNLVPFHSFPFSVSQYPWQGQTFGLRPLGDRHLARLRPSSRLILGQFVSLLVSTCRPVRFTLLGEFCQTTH